MLLAGGGAAFFYLQRAGDDDGGTAAAAAAGAIDAVWVTGRPRAQGGRHPLHENAAAGFVAARRQLLNTP